MSDIEAAMKAAGLTGEHISSRLIQVLFARVVEAEQMLRSAGSRLESAVGVALSHAEQGNVHTTTGGLPLYATTDSSADFNAALTRLLERRTALRIAIEAI